MLSCFLKRISGLIFQRVFRELRYLTLFVRDANSFTIVILVLHNASELRNYKSCMPTANYEDCPRCVGQACQTYIKYAS